MHSKGSRLSLLVLTLAARHERLGLVTSNTDVFTHRIRVGQHLPKFDPDDLLRQKKQSKYTSLHWQ